MRRHLLLAAAVSPILVAAVAASAPGCGTEEFENICAFLNEPSSCYHTFQAETNAQCWTPGEGNGPKGNFAARDKLDVCFLDEGQVIFDPPLDIAEFPPKSIAFKRLDRQAEECGSVSFSGEFSYSVTVATPCSNLDESVPECEDASGGGGVGGDAKASRTITLTTPEGRDTLDVSCANGTSHHFNRLDIQECAKEDQEKLLPRAVLEANPGSQPAPDADPAMTDQHRGFIRFRIYYPQSGATVEGKVVTDPVVVEYFDCTIPPPPPLCFNGQKDGLETDVDCGGTLCSKCGEGKFCARPEDCLSNTCERDTDGFSKCMPAGAGGAGGAGSGGADDSGGAGGAGGQ